MLFKNQSGECRLFWRLLLLVALFLLFAYLLRYIPIRIKTTALIKQGVASSAALEEASYLFMEDPTWSSIIGVIQGIFWYLLLYILIKFIEKKKFTWNELGFRLNRKQIWLLPFGLFFGILLYFGYVAFDELLGESDLIWNSDKLSIVPAILIFLNFLFNGFGEESAFRAYFQSRLMKKHGLWSGILLTSSSFVILHLLVSSFSLLAILGSILLSATYGLLFVWTGSVLLVGMMHAVFNFLPIMLGHWPSDFSLVIVNAVVLIIVTMFYLYFVRKKEKD